MIPPHFFLHLRIELFGLVIELTIRR